VVEDDDDMRNLVSDILAAENFETKAARNGLEALQIVRMKMPDLILLDMKMPAMDGWEFAARYRSEFGDAGRLAPIVVMSAAEAVAMRADEIGAVSWLGKPFAVDEVVAKVRQYAHR